MSRCWLYLRLGRVGVQVHALEVEDVVLGVGAVVQRVVAGDGQRVVKGDYLAAEDGACRGGGGEERGGDVEELHLAVCLWCDCRCRCYLDECGVWCCMLAPVLLSPEIAPAIELSERQRD
jgi:hypothetical protein